LSGVAFLHRLALAARFVMGLVDARGILLVCLYLELTGLNRFVEAAYGSQHKVAVAMEIAVVTFGREEKARLAAGMTPKQISGCEDKTFHLEKYVSNRKADKWTKAMISRPFTAT